MIDVSQIKSRSKGIKKSGVKAKSGSCKGSTMKIKRVGNKEVEVEEKSCCGHLSKSKYTEFVSDLLAEINKIDSEFTLDSSGKKSLFELILDSVKMSTECILFIKSKLSNAEKVDLENIRSNFSIQDAKLQNESEKIRISKIHLKEMESMLKLREADLIHHEESLKIKENIIKNDKETNKEIHLRCIALEQELRILKKKKCNEGQLFENNLFQIESLKLENLRLKGLIEHKIYTRTDSTDADTQTSEIFARNIGFSNTTNYIDIIQEKSSVFNEHDEKLKIFESESKHLESKEKILVELEQELQKNIFDIKEHIDIYNCELERREKHIEEREIINKATVKKINEDMVNLKLIESAVIDSLNELELIQHEVLPTIESYSITISKILTEIHFIEKESNRSFSTLCELIKSCKSEQSQLIEDKLIQDKEFESRAKEIKLAEQLLVSAKTEVTERENKLNFEISDKITALSNELQERLAKIKVKEESLIKAEENLKQKTIEHEKIALTLKCSHLEFENEKAKWIEKLRMKKEKFKVLKEKLCKSDRGTRSIECN